MDPALKKFYDKDFPFPRMSGIVWPHDIAPYARPLNERLVLTESLAQTIADMMAAELIERLKEEPETNQ